MPNGQKDQLFTLVKSLTKAEKRNFKLYVNRHQSGTGTKFMQLFDALDKQETYDEPQLLNRLPEIEKRHLSNLKRHLYQQILISLRLIYIKKNIDIQIREQLDFARILYGKGMYMQSLRLLDRIKRIAVDHHQDILHLEILEFEKLIEARHITRSRLVENKMDNLLEASTRRSYVTYTANLLSNLNIQIQGWYIEKGHARSTEEREAVKAYYAQQQPKGYSPEDLTFFEKANLYQSDMWYQYILLDFAASAKAAEEWVELFRGHPQMQEKDPDLYMRALYYVLIFLFLTGNQEKFLAYLDNFELFVAENGEQWNANSRMIGFVYLNLSRLNRHFMEGTYTEGLELAPGILNAIPEFADHTDPHRLLLFHYKIAYLYFGSGQFEAALDHLNKVLLLRDGHLREDLDLNARLLHLICQYECGNFDLLESYLLPATQRAFNRARDVSKVQRATLDFLKKLIRLPESETGPTFRAFQTRLADLINSPYERKELGYMDIPKWVESHLLGVTIEGLQAPGQARAATS